MPAAAKVENPNSAFGDVNNKGKMAANSNSNNNLNNVVSNGHDPTKIANNIIEKKIRNLEKRKARLLELKAMEDKGHELQADQKIAVKKLDGVVEMIDMLKDINKNVSDSLNDYAKQQKKQQKKDQQEKLAERQQQELERVKFCTYVQFVLSRLSIAKENLLKDESIKLEQNQFDALEKLAELSSSQTTDALDSYAEKLGFLFDGNKKEFEFGLTYSDLKETIINLVDSKYFENIPISKNVTIVDDSQVKNLSLDNSEQTNSNEHVSDLAETKAEVNFDSNQQAPNAGQIKTQLSNISFIRDPVAETELLHKDPAVVASGFAYQPQTGQPPLTSSNGSNLATSNVITNHFSSHMYPVVSLGSIPTQTFTNQSYAALIPGTNSLIPVTLPTATPHQVSFPVEQSIPIRNINIDQHSVQQPISDKPVESVPVSSENKPVNEQNVLTTSHENELSNGNALSQTNENGNGNAQNFKRSNTRGGRGGSRNFGHANSFRGRNNGKNFGGYFNSHGNSNGNFNQNRQMNRQQNVAGNRPGSYRNERTGYQNRNQIDQNFNQGQGTVIASK